ncbi:MAG: nitronate monooxygenase [Mycobacteriaceae bacterium]|nr:nitronate monooxygenase [Mycobacteriaceae bacterium]
MSLLGIDIPLLAFSHCRDVVAAVTNAGGFGVLGAVTLTPQELDQELDWIEAQVRGKPYGVDVIVPETSVGKGQRLTSEQFAQMIPAEHREYVDALLAEHGIEPLTSTRVPRVATTDDASESLLEVAFTHPIKLIANALGRPPQSMLDAAQRHGVPVAALAGAREHAIKHVTAGVDIIVAAGTEAGGHCGEVTTMVLVPEIIEAIEPIRPVPVLAAGGIVTGRQMAAAVALGAAGAWTGSVWLTTEEAETAPYTKQRMLAATSRDTIRSTCRTGKPTRQLRSDWTEAWESGKGPRPLPMPLQSMISEPVLGRIDTLAANGVEGARALATHWVGQGVGLMNTVKPARQVVYEFAQDYLAAAQRLADSLGD